MSENKWLVGVVVVLLVALVGLVCVGVGGLIYCTQPGSFCSTLFGGANVAGNPSNTPGGAATRVPPSNAPGPGSTSGPAGNVLRLPGEGDPPTLDPANSNDNISNSYVVEIFSGLVSFNKDWKIVPELAEKIDTSQDGKVFTFHLRKDAKFHDGRPVTAQDVKYSLERAADPRTRSTVAPTFLSDIVGFMDKYTGKADTISGVKVADNYTVEITIDAPKSYFLAELTQPVAYVVDKNNVESGQQPWYLQANGTGPFKLKEWDQGQRLVLTKNPDYYGDPKPSVDEVDLIIGGGSPMTMYENGDLDATMVSIADIDRVSDPSNPLNKELNTWPQLSTQFLVFNTRKPPFDDVNVRKAFAMSVDRQKLIDVVYKKMALPTNGILPQAFPGFNENIKGISYDPNQAKQLLAQSKYAGKLPDITWNTYGGGGTTGTDIQAIAEMFKQTLGANVSIEQTDWATYLSQINGTNINYQLFNIGWGADYIDPNDFLGVLFHTGSTQNWSGYSNPDVDKLLDQASVETDQNKRIQLYQQAEQIIINDVPVLPLMNEKAYWLTKPYVKGWFFPPLAMPYLKYVSLQK